MRYVRLLDMIFAMDEKRSPFYLLGAGAVNTRALRNAMSLPLCHSATVFALAQTLLPELRTVRVAGGAAVMAFVVATAVAMLDRERISDARRVIDQLSTTGRDALQSQLRLIKTGSFLLLVVVLLWAAFGRRL